MESTEAGAMQMYCALIATILMYDQFGKMSTKRQMEMLQFYFMEFVTYEKLDGFDNKFIGRKSLPR